MPVFVHIVTALSTLRWSLPVFKAEATFPFFFFFRRVLMFFNT